MRHLRQESRKRPDHKVIPRKISYIPKLKGGSLEEHRESYN